VAGEQYIQINIRTARRRVGVLMVFNPLALVYEKSLLLSSTAYHGGVII